MTERYHRNTAKPANEDIAELVFNLSEIKDERDTISITYHTEDNKISSSTREFLKPPNAEEKGAIVQWQSDAHTTFQVSPRSHRQLVVALLIYVYLFSGK